MSGRGAKTGQPTDGPTDAGSDMSGRDEKGSVVKGSVVKGGRAKLTTQGAWRGPWPEPSPWAHLLTDYAYRSRTKTHPRPLSAREIGDRCGYARQTVYKWMGVGIEPPLPVMLQVIAVLGIGAEELIRVYAQAGRDAGVELGGLLSPAAVSAPLAAPAAADPAVGAGVDLDVDVDRERDEAEWSFALASAEASMRETGMDETSVAAVLDHMRAKVAGTDAVSQLPRRRREEMSRGQGDLQGGLRAQTPASTTPSSPSSSSASSSAPGSAGSSNEHVS